MALSIVPLRLEHFQAIPRNGFAMRLSGLCAARRMVAAYRKAGPALTAMAEGIPVCCAGVVVAGRDDNLGEAWALVHHGLCMRYPVELTRVVRRLLGWIAREMELAGIVCTVHPEDLQAARWAQACGFTRTGYSTRLCNEKYTLYARMRQ